jgi:hypothetical protein
VSIYQMVSSGGVCRARWLGASINARVKLRIAAAGIELGMEGGRGVYYEGNVWSFLTGGGHESRGSGINSSWIRLGCMVHL